MSRILVWDAPTRVGHWLMAGSFAVAFVTGDSEAWRNVHVVAGYVFLATIVFRLAWGLIGTRYARFGSFVQPPAAVTGYAKSLLTGRPQHWVGHNPAGGYAILAMLILGLLAAATGILHYAGIAGDLFEEVHEAMANLALAVVAVHLVGVAVGRRTCPPRWSPATSVASSPTRSAARFGSLHWFWWRGSGSRPRGCALHSAEKSPGRRI